MSTVDASEHLEVLEFTALTRRVASEEVIQLLFTHIDEERFQHFLENSSRFESVVLAIVEVREDMVHIHLESIHYYYQ